jgi:hypothetical protein
MPQIPENKQRRPSLIANPTRIGVPSENHERGTSLRSVETCKRPPPDFIGTGSGGRYETRRRIGPARNRGKITGLVPKLADTGFAGCVRVDGAAARLAGDLQPRKKQGAEAVALHYLSVSRARHSRSAGASGPHEARATCDRETPLSRAEGMLGSLRHVIQERQITILVVSRKRSGPQDHSDCRLRRR